MIAASRIKIYADPVPVYTDAFVRSDQPVEDLCRDLLSEFDEDQLLYLEVEINAYLESGATTRRLNRLIDAVERRV